MADGKEFQSFNCIFLFYKKLYSDNRINGYFE